ncbi:ABC transporter ATP-binding protein [Anaeromyxobacter oryzisoli]|uniref:ABC transporter ATP-binding protein n=1 Tax=Anaeromyxobacter oryzisoli TaxID=2925408 RepID=UPI001F5A440B|nr:ABC transporter ATP-binding protein [Anaeromyxobacter sp. SG63]
MAIVETRKLTKVFGKGEEGAVNAVDLETRDGEFLVFLGPSGSGKSTLLRMIAGLEEPTAGDVLIGGRVVTRLPPRARGIAMVFQSYALYPHLSVARNIAFPLKAHGVPRERRLERVHWAAQLLGIGHLLERRPRELSGGERQRVALARAIVREPTVFLLDEPLSNLDAKLRASAREELTQFHKRVGTTTIYVTHDQVEAMAMGNRIAVLEKGVVRQIGTPREVYNEPADTFVATFLGSPPMNLVEAEDVIAGFRPESLIPLAMVQGPAAAVRFRVTLLEYLGSERILVGVIEGGRFDGRKVISRVATASSGGIGEGTAHDFAVPEQELKFFDRATGKRIAPRVLQWR